MTDKTYITTITIEHDNRKASVELPLGSDITEFCNALKGLLFIEGWSMELLNENIQPKYNEKSK